MLLAIPIALAIGYIAGSMRTFARLGYGGENLRMILSTLQPHFGSHRH